MADVIGTAGLLAVLTVATTLGAQPMADEIMPVSESLNEIISVFVMCVTVAALPLLICMGLALLVLLKGDYPAYAESLCSALVVGSVSGLGIGALFTGNSVPAIGLSYGAAAGLSLWIMFRGPFHTRRAN
jgi:hypothetical protein